MPASKAASVQARVCLNSTPPEKVSHEPSEISEISRSEEPSLRNFMTSTLGPLRESRASTDSAASGMRHLLALAVAAPQLDPWFTKKSRHALKSSWRGGR